VRGLSELDWGKKLRAVRVNDAPHGMGNRRRHLRDRRRRRSHRSADPSQGEGAARRLFFETLLDQLEKKLRLKNRTASKR